MGKKRDAILMGDAVIKAMREGKKLRRGDFMPYQMRLDGSRDYRAAEPSVDIGGAVLAFCQEIVRTRASKRFDGRDVGRWLAKNHRTVNFASFMRTLRKMSKPGGTVEVRLESRQRSQYIVVHVVGGVTFQPRGPGLRKVIYRAQGEEE